MREETERAAAAWDRRTLDRLIDELLVLRESMIEFESRLLPRRDELDGAGVASARNLAHYLAMRSFDLRKVQEQLADIGVSSLGRAEPQVLANLDKVLGILHLLAGRACAAPIEAISPPPDVGALECRAQVLFGGASGEHRTRIMVTLPSAAAVDDGLVEALVHGGMDVARINCAHDCAVDWVAMAARVRCIAAANGRSVKVLMDLAGPKLRTGPIAAGAAVLKLKPDRNAFGVVTSPVRLGLRPADSSVPVPGASTHVGVDGTWLARLEIADHVDLVDARASARRLTVLTKGDEGALVETQRTVYLTDETRFRLHRRGHDVHETALADLPAPEGRLNLRRGDTLRVVRHGHGHAASDGSAGKRVAVATVACTLPEALQAVRKGERIWFDDGRIGGIVRRITSKGVEVEITDAADEGSKLGADKGINLPDTRLDLPALTSKDLEDLTVVAAHADLVGLSFAQGASDVKLLRRHLRRLDAKGLGVILKVETRRGFEHLPQMLLAAMACKAAGVMIARGDLAVECGFERLAEVQEEMLWACEAAHMPVVWATQVLESQAKTGLPSRAEITDAAMGVRAECVMLNKGPHIVAALRTLGDILHRMQSHQSKKRPLLRALMAWNEVGVGDASDAHGEPRGGRSVRPGNGRHMTVDARTLP
jgi:pyruvate kinase